jgi:hypothetical protein
MATSYIAALLVEQRLSELRAEAERDRLARRAGPGPGWRRRLRHVLPLRRPGLRAGASRPQRA